MDWAPISEIELGDLLTKAEARMSPQILALWQAIKIAPQKWCELSYGTQGGGFWVVALLGENAIWYNDIEDGFNRSSYRSFGQLDSYGCNQDELEHAVRGVLLLIEGRRNTVSRIQRL